MSDWSSDVCSSDLDPARWPEIGGAEIEVRLGFDQHRLLFGAARLDQHRGDAVAVVVVAEIGEHLAPRYRESWRSMRQFLLGGGEGEGDFAQPVEQRFRARFAGDQLGEDARVELVLGDQHPGGKSQMEEHTSELQSLMRISYAVFCLE